MATVGGRRRSFAPLDAGRFEAGTKEFGLSLTRLSREDGVSAVLRQPKVDAAKSLSRLSQGAQPNHNGPRRRLVAAFPATPFFMRRFRDAR